MKTIDIHDRERGERFKREIAKLGLKQSQFAQEIAMSPVTVNRWAKGWQPPPGIVWAYLRLRGGINAVLKGESE